MFCEPSTCQTVEANSDPTSVAPLWSSRHSQAAQRFLRTWIRLGSQNRSMHATSRSTINSLAPALQSVLFHPTLCILSSLYIPPAFLSCPLHSRSLCIWPYIFYHFQHVPSKNKKFLAKIMHCIRPDDEIGCACRQWKESTLPHLTLLRHLS